MRIDTVEQLEYAISIARNEAVDSKVGSIDVPCADVHLVSQELVVANTYNPNGVPVDKLELLKQSILDNGFCFPVVTIYDPDQRKLVIVDGFHRNLIGDEKLGMAYVPVVVLKHDVSKRMAATLQFNKARGVHQVDLDAEVIRALLEQGLTEEEVSERVGLDLEAVHRYKQITGVAELFKNAEYSLAWEMVDDED